MQHSPRVNSSPTSAGFWKSGANFFFQGWFQTSHASTETGASACTSQQQQHPPQE